MVGWPPSRQHFQKQQQQQQQQQQQKTMCQSFSFLKSWPAGWPANHVSGFPHPFWGYIIGFAILLDVLP